MPRYPTQQAFKNDSVRQINETDTPALPSRFLCLGAPSPNPSTESHGANRAPVILLLFPGSNGFPLISCCPSLCHQAALPQSPWPLPPGLGVSFPFLSKSHFS